jgi:3-hydroxymyristoyl/3-hydroxydecanoyl-(acyl carrier protein) dehydratase
MVTNSSPLQPSVIETEFTVPADSPWFSGHFPDNPILPGVAQLEMVVAAITGISGKNLYVSRLGRVKFKNLVRPGERLRLQARPTGGLAQGPGAFTFSIHAGDKEVCSGNMILSEKSGQTYEHT